jgi:hypothetical protein
MRAEMAIGGAEEGGIGIIDRGFRPGRSRSSFGTRLGWRNSDVTGLVDALRRRLDDGREGRARAEEVPSES